MSLPIYFYQQGENAEIAVNIGPWDQDAKQLKATYGARYDQVVAQVTAILEPFGGRNNGAGSFTFPDELDFVKCARRIVDVQVALGDLIDKQKDLQLVTGTNGKEEIALLPAHRQRNNGV